MRFWNAPQAITETNDDPVYWHIYASPVAPFTNMV